MNWTPVRRGKTFCSSACGRGCTLAEYLKAHREAAATLERMKTKGWQVRVWENLGWHWELRYGNHLTVSGSHEDRTKNFHAMLSTRGNGGCDPTFYDRKRFADPNDAVAHRLKIAEASIRPIQKLLKQLGALK